MVARSPHARNLRKGRVSLPNHTYLITIVTEGRTPHFVSLTRARCLVRVLMAEETTGAARTLCFVIMPDHLHWLMVLGEREPLSVVVRRIKVMTARLLGERLWQKGYHDHALRRDEDVKAVARYVVANPLRAGLVDRLGDYPHWYAVWV